MEPGVLRGYRCTGSVFPGSVVMRRPIHDASDKPSNTRSAVPIYGLEWWVQRLRPFGAEQYRRYDMDTIPFSGTRVGKPTPKTIVSGRVTLIKEPVRNHVIAVHDDACV